MQGIRGICLAVMVVLRAKVSWPQLDCRVDPPAIVPNTSLVLLYRCIGCANDYHLPYRCRSA